MPNPEKEPPGDPSPIASGTPAAKPSPPPGAISTEPLNTPPIPLDNSLNPASPAAAKTAKKEEPKDAFRELIETIVFVVVLVLMLKTFLAEAFVIPTGSMATTLLGYHHKFICPQCGKENLVNASSWADPQDRPKQRVTEWDCQNCNLKVKR